MKHPVCVLPMLAVLLVASVACSAPLTAITPAPTISPAAAALADASPTAAPMHTAATVSPSATSVLPPTATLTPFPTETYTPLPTPTFTSEPTRTSAPAPTATAISAPTAAAELAPCTASLRECAARKQMQIGTYLTGKWFSDAKWQGIVAREFNLAVNASNFYWDEVEAERGRFNFAAADEQVAYARSKNMTICGHALLLAEPSYLPAWLANGNFSRDELSQILREYIAQVMGHYKGQIDQYIVVEDPYPLSADDIFYRQFGYDYIELAFQIARETDPSATLIFNAGDNETSAGVGTEVTRLIVQRLKAKSLIDGVGLEMHLDATKPYTKPDVIATMKSYGVPVYVTEMDVDLTNIGGKQEDRYAKQAQIYGDMLAACRESGVCKSFAVWGIGDKYSWLENGASNADPTLFDDKLNPKPAYFALLDQLR